MCNRHKKQQPDITRAPFKRSFRLTHALRALTMVAKY